MKKNLDRQQVSGRGRKVWRQRWLPYLFLACLMTLIARVPHLQHWRIADYIDAFGLDGCFERRGALPPKVVAEQLWPTKDFLLLEVPHNAPPELLPELIEKTRTAKVVAIDVMLVDKRAELQPDAVPLFGSEPARWKKETELLAAVIAANKNVIVGSWPELQQLPVPGTVNTTAKRIIWQRPAPAIWKAARWHAHLLVEPAPEDSITRRVSLFQNTNYGQSSRANWYGANRNERLPALSLAVAAAVKGLEQEEIAKLSTRNGQLKLGKHGITVSDSDPMIINYRGGREQFDNRGIHWNYVFAYDCEPEDFAGKIVFLGRTDFTAKDDFTTPFFDMPGVHVHMHAAATLLDSKGPPLPLPLWQTSLIALALCILLLFSLQKLRLSGSLLVAVLLCGLTFLICFELFLHYHRYLPVSVPVLAVILTYNGVALYEYGRTRTVLARFVGADLMSALLNPMKDLALGGQTEVATAFFCDLRRFSTAAEQLSPQVMEPLVNAYTSTVTEVAQQFGGRVIDYFGDGVFVLFRQPGNKPGNQHALQAVRAAIEAQKAVIPVLSNWSQVSQVELEFAVGINSGEMVIGVIGSADHMKLGAVGDAVIVASRVQSLSSICQFDILVTKDTYDLISDEMTLEECGRFRIKGRQQEVQIFGTGHFRRENLPENLAENLSENSFSTNITNGSQNGLQ
jgi:class 3 adenylate cyclase/CHASE2 domain-containing sensor protein